MWLSVVLWGVICVLVELLGPQGWTLMIPTHLIAAFLHACRELGSLLWAIAG